jgi:phosphoribosylglycinamide formyltransferase 1
MNLGFLASGRGSTMQAVIDACKSGRLRAKPCVVISNNRDAQALARAWQEGIPAYHLSAKTEPNPGLLDAAILHTLQHHEVELVILAGYMKKLGMKTLTHYWGRILNIHPSLLPKFGGQGRYGIHVHEAVLAAGEKETGATVHLVEGEEYDQGTILSQCRVPVYTGDTADTLAQRVLVHEHRLLVETLEQILVGKLALPEVLSCPQLMQRP